MKLPETLESRNGELTASTQLNHEMTPINKNGEPFNQLNIAAARRPNTQHGTRNTESIRQTQVTNNENVATFQRLNPAFSQLTLARNAP
jgi:hypothetical protein